MFSRAKKNLKYYSVRTEKLHRKKVIFFSCFCLFYGLKFGCNLSVGSGTSICLLICDPHQLVLSKFSVLSKKICCNLWPVNRSYLLHFSRGLFLRTHHLCLFGSLCLKSCTCKIIFPTHVDLLDQNLDKLENELSRIYFWEN